MRSTGERTCLCAKDLLLITEHMKSYHSAKNWLTEFSGFGHLTPLKYLAYCPLLMIGLSHTSNSNNRVNCMRGIQSSHPYFPLILFPTSFLLINYLLLLVH